MEILGFRPIVFSCAFENSSELVRVFWAVIFVGDDELLIEIFRYYASIRRFITLDWVVFERFFENGDHLRCDDIEQLSSEWNALFNATHPPIFNAPYTVDRVAFWCNDALGMTDNNLRVLRSFLKIKAHSGRSGHDHLILNATGMENTVFRALRETALIPSTISVDDVLIAWLNRYEIPGPFFLIIHQEIF